MPADTAPVSPLRPGFVASMLEGQIALCQSFLQAQRSQLQVLAAWEQSMAAAQQDLWDQWKCRFGGVPLDG